MDTTNRRAMFYGYIYPGSGSGSQTNTFLKSDGTHFDVQLRDAAGVYLFRVLNSSGNIVWGATSQGQMVFPGSDSTTPSTIVGRIPIFFGGNLRYLAVYS
jgi:hypothetical protein